MSFFRRINSVAARWQQSRYDLTSIKNARRLIIFLIPFVEEVNGGVMSIFSLCEYSRRAAPDTVSVLCTEPNRYTYARNRKFLNNEKIYNLKQVLDNCEKVEELVIHLPEYLASKFYRRLTPEQHQFLQKVPEVRINILNQNIELMPARKGFENLFLLSPNISQTTAHDRYATQEVCNRFGIPLHHFSVHIDISKYKKYSFAQKEKLLVFSPDSNPYRQKIADIIARELPEYKIITVRNMTFEQYMELIARAFAVISFGEGYDGYFVQPWYVGSLGLAVYNENFFPDVSWRGRLNVYQSFTEMGEKLAADVRCWAQNERLYYQIIREARELNDRLYSEAGFLDNLVRFYKGQYDFYPQ